MGSTGQASSLYLAATVLVPNVSAASGPILTAVGDFVSSNIAREHKPQGEGEKGRSVVPKQGSAHNERESDVPKRRTKCQAPNRCCTERRQSGPRLGGASTLDVLVC